MTSKSVKREQAVPYLELRIGSLHLVLRRRPARLLAVLSLVLLTGGGWALGRGIVPPL
ncbi:hypothetical protein ABT160_25490 [Streptomyces sp. NPDC001941]|uniref:hypothetical protein n=1 Tax=Streptomyces sp. NPDC001941 TaxID=3154659 RepID=UPI00332C15F9